MINIYAVYDTKGECFGLPFFLKTEGLAVRMFLDAIKDERTNINKYPLDYSLYFIGEYDESNADIISKKEAVKVVITGREALIMIAHHNEMQQKLFPVKEVEDA